MGIRGLVYDVEMLLYSLVDFIVRSPVFTAGIVSCLLFPLPLGSEEGGLYIPPLPCPYPSISISAQRPISSPSLHSLYHISSLPTTYVSPSLSPFAEGGSAKRVGGTFAPGPGRVLAAGLGIA